MDAHVVQSHTARGDTMSSSPVSTSLAAVSATAQPTHASPDRQTLRDARVPAFLLPAIVAAATTTTKGPVGRRGGGLDGAPLSNPDLAAPAAAAAAAPPSSEAATSPRRPSPFRPLSLGSSADSAMATSTRNSGVTGDPTLTALPMPVPSPPIPPPREGGVVPYAPGAAAATAVLSMDGTDGVFHSQAAAATLLVPHIAVTAPPAFQYIQVPHSHPSPHGPPAALMVRDGGSFASASSSPITVAVPGQQQQPQQQQQRSRVDTSLPTSSPDSSGAPPCGTGELPGSSRTVSYAVHRVTSRTHHPLFHHELQPLYTQCVARHSTTDLTTSRSRQHSATATTTTMPVFGSGQQDKQQWHSPLFKLRARHGNTVDNNGNSCSTNGGGGAGCESSRGGGRPVESGSSGVAHDGDGAVERPGLLWPPQGTALAMPAVTQPGSSSSLPQPASLGDARAAASPLRMSFSAQTMQLSTQSLQSTPYVGPASVAASDVVAGRGGARSDSPAAAGTTGALGDVVEGTTLTSPLELGTALVGSGGRQASNQLPHYYPPPAYTLSPTELQTFSATSSSGMLSGDKIGTVALYPAASPRRSRAVPSTSFIAAVNVVPGYSGPEMSLVSLLSPLQQQFTQAQYAAVAAMGPTAWGRGGPVGGGAAAAFAARSGPRPRDLRRGTWVFALAREERVAREGIEADETKEALQCLPASWTVWRSYLPPGSDSDDAETPQEQCCSETCGTGTEAPSQAATITPPSSIASPLYDTMTVTSAFSGSLGSELGGGPAMRTSPDLVSYRALTRQRNASAACAAAAHPALVAAVYRLTLLETLRRDAIVAEEEAAHRDGVARPLVYEHRLLTVGTLPLEKFLRRWVARHRSRHRHSAHALAQVVAQEAEARAALHATSCTLQRRFATMCAALLEEEHRYRTTLELLWVQDAAWTGVVLLRLQEQVVRFPLAYGGRMSRTRACGRVEGLTRFRNLALAEEATRAAIAGAEALERARWPQALALEVLCCTGEPLARTALGAVEEAERADVEQVLRALETHYSLREVAIEESLERQSWQLAGQRRDGAVGGGDGAAARRPPPPSHGGGVPAIDVEL